MLKYRFSKQLLALALALAPVVGMQQLEGQAPSPTGGTVPTPTPADVETIDGIITALYAAISGPAGQERDWDRMRSLMVPEARLIPTRPAGADGSPGTATVRPVEGYISAATGLMTNGFFEVEIGRVTERFENIAHVFSTYESRRTEDGPLIQKGINSIQLMWDGQRWWIFNIFWRGVPPNFEIPARYVNR